MSHSDSIIIFKIRFPNAKVSPALFAHPTAHCKITRSTMYSSGGILVWGHGFSDSQTRMGHKSLVELARAYSPQSPRMQIQIDFDSVSRREIIERRLQILPNQIVLGAQIRHQNEGQIVILTLCRIVIYY